jgi:hypothetical protein
MRYSLWSVGLQLSVSAFCFIGFIFTLYTRPPDILLSSLLCAALGFFLWGLVRYYRVWNFSFFHAASYFLVAPIIGWMLLRNSLLAWRKGGINWRGSFYPLQTLVENQRVLLAADFIFGYPRKESPSNEKY